MLLNCGVESPLDSKEIQSVHPKGNPFWIFIGRTWCLSWNSNILATWCEELTHLKRPWCQERLKAGREGDDRMRWLDGTTDSMDMLLLLLLSRFSCVQLCATPETAAHQAPPSLRFSRQEHWSGLPFPSPKIHYTSANQKWRNSDPNIRHCRSQTENH